MRGEGYMKRSYLGLDIYRRSKDLAIAIHRMSLALPSFELFEEGSQIRRSSKSVPANIVEGYCPRHHKNEYLQYLHRALGACQETRLYLEILFETGSLTDGALFNDLCERYDHLGRMLFRYIESVTRVHCTPRYADEIAS